VSGRLWADRRDPSPGREGAAAGGGPDVCGSCLARHGFPTHPGKPVHRRHSRHCPGTHMGVEATPPSGRPRQVILVLPPVSRDELRRRRDTFVRVARSLTRVDLPEQISGRAVLATFTLGSDRCTIDKSRGVRGFEWFGGDRAYHYTEALTDILSLMRERRTLEGRPVRSHRFQKYGDLMTVAFTSLVIGGCLLVPRGLISALWGPVGIQVEPDTRIKSLLAIEALLSSGAGIAAILARIGVLARRKWGRHHFLIAAGTQALMVLNPVVNRLVGGDRYEITIPAPFFSGYIAWVIFVINKT
jgi:hypothetical protein